MFITTGDIMMPSAAVCAARLAAKHGLGAFGSNLFANSVVDPSKQDAKNIVCFFDSDATKQSGNLRTLASGTTWYVDEIIVTASSERSEHANALLRKYVNFLCSVRTHPVFCDDDQIWYRFLHITLKGRAKRVGKTTGGMELYEGVLRVAWRPMSSRDPDYKETTGIV